MLSHLMFNVFILSDDVELGNNENFGSSPIISKDVFHSQFKLNLETYRDNNNFLVHNHISTSDARYDPTETTKTFEFLEMTMSPVWTGPAMINKYYMSNDLGVTYQN